jgi:hypothetical protein
MAVYSCYINTSSLLEQRWTGQSNYYSTRESLMKYEGKTGIYHISDPAKVTVIIIENRRTAPRA